MASVPLQHNRPFMTIFKEPSQRFLRGKLRIVKDEIPFAIDVTLSSYDCFPIIGVRLKKELFQRELSEYSSTCQPYIEFGGKVNEIL